VIRPSSAGCASSAMSANILLIFDEVFRSAWPERRLWDEKLGVEPDCDQPGQGLGGGIAIGRLPSRQADDHFRPADHSLASASRRIPSPAALALTWPRN